MTVTVDIQRDNGNAANPSDADIRHWLTHCLNAQHPGQDFEVSICIVSPGDIQALNKQYRNKPKPTNVLSFPTNFPKELGITLLGDIVICADILAEEAKAQGKTLQAHWAHIVIHGLLHLQGYDHINDTDASIMENLEIQYLQQLGFNNPYEYEENPS